VKTRDMNYCFIFLFLLSAAVGRKNYQLSLDHLVINRFSLSITGLLFNPSQIFSDWIDNNLGLKSVFFNYNSLKYPLSNEEKQFPSRLFKEYFALPDYAYSPKCSFELMGFIYSNAFLKTFIKSTPLVGNGSLHILDHNLDCFYRSHQKKQLEYWPIFIYCPIQANNQNNNISVCQTINENFLSTKSSDLYQQSNVNINTTNIDENKNIFNNNFEKSKLLKLSLNIENQPEKYSINLKLKRTIKLNKNDANEFAVCLPTPYISNDNTKSTIYNSIVFEFIRYYTNIDFKVLLYDRGGEHIENIFNNKYLTQPMNKNTTANNNNNNNINNNDNKSNSNNNSFNKIKFLHNYKNQHNLIYHNYTLLELLHPSSYLQYQYELKLNIAKLQKLVFITDMDKVLTYTQCRFDALSRFGIDTVLVVDADEFLYCLNSNGDMKSYIKKYIENEKFNKKINQLNLYQRIFYKKGNLTIKKCLIEKINSNSDSIFDCFSSAKFFEGFFIFIIITIFF
jgi:hypothetical protein